MWSVVALAPLIAVLALIIGFPGGAGVNAQELQPKPVIELPGAVVYDTPGLVLDVEAPSLPGTPKYDPEKSEKCNTCHEGIEPISDHPAIRT